MLSGVQKRVFQRAVIRQTTAGKRPYSEVSDPRLEQIRQHVEAAFYSRGRSEMTEKYARRWEKLSKLSPEKRDEFIKEFSKVFSSIGLNRDADGKITSPTAPTITPEMQEFLKKNNMPDINPEEIGKRIRAKIEERRKASENPDEEKDNSTFYEQMAEASKAKQRQQQQQQQQQYQHKQPHSQPEEEGDIEDEEFLRPRQRGEFDFPELSQYDSTKEQIEHLKRKLKEAGSDISSFDMLEDITNQPPPKKPYTTSKKQEEKPWYLEDDEDEEESDDSNLSRPQQRSTTEEPFEIEDDYIKAKAERDVNQLDFSELQQSGGKGFTFPFDQEKGKKLNFGDLDWNNMTDEKIFDVLRQEDFSKFVREQTGQNAEEVQEEIKQLEEKLRVAQTLKGKESFDSFLSRKHDPKQPEKFDYVSDQFKEEMGGSLGDIGKAMPEARDQYFGKDTEHGKWLNKKVPEIALGEIPLLLLDYNKLAGENLVLRQQLEIAQKELAKLKNKGITRE